MWTGMDLTSTPRAAENRTRWNMNVTKSSVVPKQLSRIEIKSAVYFQIWNRRNSAVYLPLKEILPECVGVVQGCHASKGLDNTNVWLFETVVQSVLSHFPEGDRSEEKKSKQPPPEPTAKEAVYGGRISGRTEKGLKVNPIYHDSNHNNHKRGQGHKDHNGNMNGICLEMYETFPHKKEQIVNSDIAIGSTKNQQPSLLGHACDPDSTNVDATHQKVSDNQNHIQQNMKGHSEVAKTSVKSSPNNDEIFSDLKIQKVPNGNYALLGYNNEGYEDEIEIHVDKENSVQDNSVKNQRSSLSVCHSIDSSPSRSSVSSSDSPSKHGKFLTEVSVHTVRQSEDSELSARLESYDPVTNTEPDVCNSERTAGSDWPDSKETGISQEENSPNSKVEHVNDIGKHRDVVDSSSEVATKAKDKVNSNSLTNLHDVIVTFEGEQETVKDKDSEIHSCKGNSSKLKSKTYTKNSALNSKSSKPKTEHTDLKDGSQSPGTLKSILHASIDNEKVKSNSTHTRTKSDSEIQEAKSVKFSEDTVFNESKTKKYKNEKIDRLNLRHIYHGRVSSDSAMAKLNPLFKDDLEEYDQDSLTDDEKVAYRLSVRNMMESGDKTGSLNTPAYMDKYLVLRTQGLKGIDLDIETLPDVPAHDRLIQRTVMKKRRKLIIKWTLVVLTVIVITATATVIGVYLKNNG